MRLIAVAAAAMLCASCTTYAGEERRARLVGDLSADAIAFNEAYAQAMTGQILVNILRARDRLPTQYLAMSAIQDSPSITSGQSLTLGSINLGDIASPWAVGEAGITRGIERQPSYSVAPFSAGDLRNIMFEPTDPGVFAEYWNAGWPKDLLLFLLADRIVRISPDPAARVIEFENDAGDFRDDCAEAVATRGCDYVRLARTLARELAGQGPDRVTSMSAVCGFVAAYAPARPRALAAGATLTNCDSAARIIVGDVEYVIFLRSLNDIVFYLGELLRDAGAAADAFNAPIRVGAAGIPRGGQGVPLFRVTTAGAGRTYAAAVSYGGARYFAGPAISRSCPEVTPDGPCRDDFDSGDRSSQVLALLMQLLLRNQSDESRPPPPSILITQ